MAKTERVIFQRLGKAKTTIENEPVVVFQFCFQLCEA